MFRATQSRLLLLNAWVCAVASIVFSSGSTADAALLDNLVGHWTFDGNYSDTSMSVNHGAAFGTPGPSFTAGKIGQAVSVTALTGYVQTIANVGISGNQARTLNVWVNPPSTTVNTAPVSTGGTGNGKLFDLYLRSDGQFGGHFYGGSWDTLASPNPTYAANSWTMATLVYQGGNTVDVYKDGQFFETAPIPGMLSTTDSKLSIGAGGAFGPVHTGKVDDVALWNRALSAAEIQSIYQAAQQGYSLYVPPPLALPQFRVQFDMGQAVGVAQGMHGPGHVAGLFSGNQWNVLGSSSTGNYANLSVVDEFGNPLTVDENGEPISLTVQLAANNGAAPLTNWGNVQVGDWGGLSGLQGINYTELMRDALYVSAGSREVMGIRIGGLPMGQYEVFMMPKYSGSISRQQVAIGLNLNSLVGTSFLSPAGSFNTWVQGTDTLAGNYYRALVFVPGRSDWLTMLFDNLDYTTTEFMGFQIARVAVPEPSTLMLLVVGLAAAAIARATRG